MIISIIGAGAVGSTIAFSLLSLADEIELVDTDEKKAMAECFDLQDAAKIMLSNCKISYSTRPHTADIYIFCAGKRRTNEENRNDLYVDNRNLMEKILREIQYIAYDPWVLIVTNPSGSLAKDALDYFRKVIACGHYLDVVRSKMVGMHETPENLQTKHNAIIRDGKGGITNWGIAAEVRKIVEELVTKE